MTARQGVGKEERIYTQRFSEREEATRALTWEVLCRDFFQSRVPFEATVLDVGAGDGLFLRNIRCRHKIAVDLSEHARELEAEGIETHIVPATEYAHLLSAPADVVMMSNFLEHLPDKNLLLEVLAHCWEALTPNGALMILQPNIRYTGPAYWDYIDHHIALTEHSLVEALEITGYEVEELIPRFLPYTAKSGLGRLASGEATKHFVKLYLKFPIVWRFLGAQTFVLAKKKSS